VFWNVNILSAGSIADDILHRFTSPAPVLAALCEVGCTHSLAAQFPQHDVFEVQAEECKRGTGLLLAVPTSSHYQVVQLHADSASIVCLLQDSQCQPLLLVGVVYIPCKSHRRNVQTLVHDAYAQLTAVLADYPGTPVVLGGDFNADTSRQNFHLEQLVTFAEDNALTVYTGCSSSDKPPLPSFYRKAQPISRIDHMCVTPSLIPYVAHCTVQPLTRHSDHCPISTRINLALPNPNPMPVPRGTILPPAWRWRRALQQSYAEGLLAQGPHLGACEHLSQLDHPFAAATALMHAVTAAATSARLPKAPRGPGTPKRAPLCRYLDATGREMRRNMRKAWREEPHSHQYVSLASKYRKYCAARKGIWAFHQSKHMHNDAKWDPRGLHRRIRPARPHIPLALQDPTLWDPLLRKLMRRDASYPDATMVPTDLVPAERTSAAAPLNEAFSEAELEAALKRLNNGRSAGYAGFPSELYRYAVYIPPADSGEQPRNVLVPALTSVMNAVLRTSHVPSDWCLSIITPVYKSGSRLDVNNYRPIAVGEPLARLLAVLLNERLSKYLENNHLLSDSQAGFRPVVSTTYQLFLLQHLIDKHVGLRTSLYALKVDLKSAYDLVVHWVLWECLRRMGIHGSFLTLVKSLYSTAQVAVRINDRIGSRVHPLQGVRQGCPLSPTLFNIVMADLSEHLHRAVVLGTVPMLYHPVRRKICDLQFADDLMLLATRMQGLQGLTNALRSYCLERGLVISLVKTKATVLVKGRDLEVVHVQLNNQPLEVVDKVQYLGWWFAPPYGLMHNISSHMSKGRAAFASLHRRLRALPYSASVLTLKRLYQTCVITTYGYASEVFAAHPRYARAAKGLCTMFFTHLRSLFRLHNTSDDVVCDALDLRSAQQHWDVSVVRLWESLWQSPNEFWQHVVQDVWYDCVYRPDVQNVAHGVLSIYQRYGLPVTSPVSLHDPPKYGKDKLLDRMDKAKCAQWLQLQADPRIAPSQGVTLCTYATYCRRPLNCTAPPLHELPLAPSVQFTLFHFLCGQHLLPIRMGRFTRPITPRSQRHCVACATTAIGDEQHMIFECPAVQHLRAPDLFDTLRPRTVAALIWHDRRFAVARFLLDALRICQVPPPEGGGPHQFA
jgi:hypothetical protein